MNEYETARAEARIQELLAKVYLPTGVEMWLYSRNRNLGMKAPAELIDSGQHLAVLAEAERLSGGAW